MLARARLGDDLLLAHAPGQQRLADAIVDLVRAGVIELFALEVDFRAFSRLRLGAQRFGQALGIIKRVGPTDIGAQQFGEFGVERRVGLRRLVDFLQLQDQRHQCFGDVTTAERPEMPMGVGLAAQAVGQAGRSKNIGHEIGLSGTEDGRSLREGEAISAIVVRCA